jgi:hypothetical protein
MVLVSGITLGEDEQGRLRLARTGPFVPPISFPWGCVVTNELRRELDHAGLRGLRYREVIKAKIVRIEWQHWDRNADLEDDQLPACEPGDYIFKGRNSPRLAREMTPLWEITPEVRLKCMTVADGSTALVGAEWPDDIAVVFYLGFGRQILVNERVRDFLTARCGEWCEFEQMPVTQA